MQIRLVPFMFLVSLLILAGAHASALIFYLYWIYPWFDIPVHVLGGMTVALGFFYFASIRGRLSVSMQGIVGTLLFTFLVGVLWETYEHFLGAHVDLAIPFDTIDTISDVCLDMIGGVIGYYVATALSKLENTEHV